MFILDLLLNFFVAFVDDDMQMITDHAIIAQQYLRGWFWVDLLGGFPVDWMIPETWGALTSVNTEASDAAAASVRLTREPSERFHLCLLIMKPMAQQSVITTPSKPRRPRSSAVSAAPAA